MVKLETYFSKKGILLACFLIFSQLSFSQTKYQKDFQEFWTEINNNHAYLDKQAIDWLKVKKIYEPEVEKISNDHDFIQLLEHVINELYNGHSSLSRNLNTSNNLVPSGLDLLVEKV